jgi:hypothetical protein
MIHRVIKHITDTNILNELNDSYKKERDENISSSSAELKASFRFDNMTMSHMNEIHFLYKSVIYDSECSDFLTYDRDRFVNDLRSANEWIKTFNELMNVTDYETMIVHDKLNNKTIKLKFVNIAWISFTDVILISSTRLIKEDYDRDPHTNILMHMKTGTKVCEISMQCNVLLLKFNFISQEDLNKHANANSVQSRKSTVAKATPWFWHLRLGHCRPEVIHLFEKLSFNSDQKMIIYNDNLQTIRLLISKIAKVNTKLRHVDIAQCWLRQSVQQEKIGVGYLLTAHMVIDEMIKLLLSQRHKQFIQQLRLINVKSLMNDEISR